MTKKARMSKSKFNTMLIYFLNSKGIIYHESVPPKQSPKHYAFKFRNAYSSTLIIIIKTPDK
jgi:hypothetical protein